MPYPTLLVPFGFFDFAMSYLRFDRRSGDVPPVRWCPIDVHAVLRVCEPKPPASRQDTLIAAAVRIVDLDLDGLTLRG
jgi:hypothetical protein